MTAKAKIPTCEPKGKTAGWEWTEYLGKALWLDLLFRLYFVNPDGRKKNCVRIKLKTYYATVYGYEVASCISYNWRHWYV